MIGLYNCLMQFHEHTKVINAWIRWFHPLLEWLSPSRRRTILALMAVWYAIKLPLKMMKKGALSEVAFSELWSQGLVIVALFGLVWGCFALGKRYAQWPLPIKRHPLLALHAVYWLMLCSIYLLKPMGGFVLHTLYGVALCMPFLLWRLGYLAQSAQQGRVAKSRFRDQWFIVWPAFGGSNTPYGKGLDFLTKFEAQDTRALAESQLAGLKLFFLAGLWHYVLRALDTYVYVNPDTASFGITKLSVLIQQTQPFPLLDGWASIYLELIVQVLEHAVKGLHIVAILRLFGFNVFRNTYKPLLAESIVEFWNRYYYYFKELLSSQFFMPTFMQLGKRLASRPKLRLGIAVFAAAFVGNMYYHVIKDAASMVDGQVLDTIYTLRSRFFYCLLLALGIFVSMWRQQTKTRELSYRPFHRFLRIAGVWTFFSLIFIWNVDSTAGFWQRVHFFMHLFGIVLPA